MAVLGVVALVISIVIGVGTARDRLRDRTTLGLGQEGTVTVTSPAAYTIYYVGPVVARSRADLPSLRSRLSLRISGPDGATVPTRPYEAWNERSAGMGQAVAVRTVRFASRGDYLVRVGGLEGVPDEDAYVAFTESGEGALARWALTGVAAAAVGVALGILWAILLAGARRRAQRAAGEPGPWGPPPGGGPRAPWPGPAGPLPDGVGWGPAGPVVVPPVPAGYEASHAGSSPGR